jgi:hypothetical protein
MEQREKYPWYKWADGERHDIQRNKHFDIPVEQMRLYLHDYARNHKIRVETHKMENATLRFRFTKHYWWE